MDTLKLKNNKDTRLMIHMAQKTYLKIHLKNSLHKNS